MPDINANSDKTNSLAKKSFTSVSFTYFFAKGCIPNPNVRTEIPTEKSSCVEPSQCDVSRVNEIEEDFDMESEMESGTDEYESDDNRDDQEPEFTLDEQLDDDIESEEECEQSERIGYRLLVFICHIFELLWQQRQYL